MKATSSETPSNKQGGPLSVFTFPFLSISLVLVSQTAGLFLFELQYNPCYSSLSWGETSPSVSEQKQPGLTNKNA